MKRGPKPKGQVRIRWSPAFAYAIGLLTADGCLLNDGRHIDFTSKDKELVESFKKCLGLSVKIGTKRSGQGNRYYRIQFGDVLFRNFLLSIGLTPAKSKSIKSVVVPDRYFADFLRGYFDGDGSTTSYFDRVFPNSFRTYMSFTSASEPFLLWLKAEIQRLVGAKGSISKNTNHPGYCQLKYAKRSSLLICSVMYYPGVASYLSRKHLKIRHARGIIDGRRGGEIGRHATFRS